MDDFERIRILYFPSEAELAIVRWFLRKLTRNRPAIPSKAWRCRRESADCRSAMAHSHRKAVRTNGSRLVETALR